MVDATDSRPGLYPDRASFTFALNTARDQIVHAAGVIADTALDPRDQTIEQQILSPRLQHRPAQLPSHYKHQHHQPRRLTTTPTT
jgi:hypothetical protein